MLGEERRKSMEGLEKGWRDGKRTRAETKQGGWKRGERWIFPCCPRPPRAVLAAKRHLTISRVRTDGEIQI